MHLVSILQLVQLSWTQLRGSEPSWRYSGTEKKSFKGWRCSSEERMARRGSYSFILLGQHAVNALNPGVI
jgi:hypothetical protein